jgi:galactokinase
VNGRRLAERLIAAGLDPLELQPKERLLDVTLGAFANITRADPDMVSWVPGRLEVFGTHTDYAGGRTLVAALPRGFVFAATRRADGMLRVVDAVARESLTIDIRKHAATFTGWRRYVEVVLDRLTRNFPGAAPGADIAFASDLPRAAGMSSSSALIVGLTSTLVRLSGIVDREEWHREVPTRLQEAGYYACIENGRSFGALTGHHGVGTHGGSEDHAAMLCGTAGVVTTFAFVPMRQIGTAAVPHDWQFVVASSGVAAEKTGAALASYNRLARGAAILLDLWNAREAPAESLAAALGTGPDAFERLQNHIERSRVEDWPPETLTARLRHFIREDARVASAEAAFRGTDAGRVALLAADSQSDSEHLLRNQLSQTVGLARLAIESGAFSSRSFGAGFGGGVWALVRRDRAHNFASDWLRTYQQSFGISRPSLAFLASPAPGLIEFS